MEKAVILIDILKRYFDRLPIRAENRRIINLPNAITLLRIGILPVLFLVLLEPGEAMSLAIAILFILAALTDLLDGYVARRYNTKLQLFWPTAFAGCATFVCSP